MCINLLSFFLGGGHEALFPTMLDIDIMQTDISIESGEISSVKEIMKHEYEYLHNTLK